MCASRVKKRRLYMTYAIFYQNATQIFEKIIFVEKISAQDGSGTFTETG